jgi:S1-C subfamily serine protease
MSIAVGLILVLAVFLSVLTTVIVISFRERHLAEKLRATDVDAERASDKRVMITIFGSIAAGIILTLVSAVLILNSVDAHAQDEFHPALYLPIAASIVRVEADVDHGHLSVGSGVTVAPGVVATNCHVVHDAKSIRILGRGDSWEVDAEHADVHHDVCLLHVPGWEGAPVRMASPIEPEIGATVVALGFTGGAPITPRVGTVHALHEYETGHVIEADAAFNSGASGGGLFDADGALVGLLAFRLRNSQASYYALPASWVRDDMPRPGEWDPVKPLDGGTAFWQGDNDALPAFLRQTRD